MFDNEFPPLGGGTGVVNYHLLRELAEYPDIHVDLVTSSRTRSTYETEQFDSRIRLFKVPVDNTNIHHARNIELIRYSARGFRVSRRLAAQHAYDLSFAFAGVPAGALSYALARTIGLPYLVSLQGPDIPDFEQRYASLYPVLKPVLRRVWRKAEAVIAISEDNRRLAQAFMPEIDIDVINNGVDTRTFMPGERHAPASDVHIVCVGRLIDRKGQHHLLHAADTLRRRGGTRFRISIVGTGDAEQSLKEQCRALGLDHVVTFAGVVDRQDMPRIYHEADIFVLPSHNEGMSIALLEAMASGLPVVVTQTGGSDELVRDGVNGLVVQWADRTGLAEALHRLVTDDGMRCRMGTAGVSRARDFSWKTITGEYLRLFERVLRGRSDKGAMP
jgi:phosphatidylinositol alpha-1,6-mannosyltransferase